MENVTTTVPIEEVTIELLLAHMCLRPQVFRVAKIHLVPEHFNGPGETAYRLVTRALYEYEEQYRELPNRESLSTFAMAKFPEEVVGTEEDYQKIQAFTSWLSTSQYVTAEQYDDRFALDVLKALLVERKVRDNLMQSVSGFASTGNTALPAVIQKANQSIQEIAAINRVANDRNFPEEGVVMDVEPIIPTGVQILDDRMQGGCALTEICTVLGPTGGGKTTLCMQLICAYAKTQWLKEKKGEGRGKLAVFISYEAQKKELLVRSICCAARIQRTRLEAIRDWNNELARDRMPYEQHVEGDHFQCEYDRYKFAYKWLNEYTYFADFTGHRDGDNPPRGADGIPEIKNELLIRRDSFDRPIGLVVSDWAGVAVQRNLIKEKKEVANNLTVVLGQYVDEFKNSIAHEFEAPCWITHQLKGQANNRAPTANLNHADAQWCSTFAQHSDFNFIIGNEDKPTHTCQFKASKTRRGREGSSTICYINGEFGELTPCDRHYAVVKGQIVRASEAGSLGYHDGYAAHADQPDINEI
jgi:hypothetical protein